MHHEITSSKPPSSISVTRSMPKTYTSNRVECGNCRGTGSDGFNIMPDSFECEACHGKGYLVIDPNAKYVTLEELAKKYRDKNSS